MKNQGLFSTLFIEDVRDEIQLDDTALGRMASLRQTWTTADKKSGDALWSSFMKQAMGFLQFAPANSPVLKGTYPLYEGWDFSNCVTVLYLVDSDAEIDDKAVGRFWPAKLIAALMKRKLNWGILTNGAEWRLYSLRSARPYEDYVSLPLGSALETNDEHEYGLFERFFHKDSFVAEKAESEMARQEEAAGVYKCRLDRDKETSEEILEDYIKDPLLFQVDEVLQYICNGFIHDTPRKGVEYTEEERKGIFESAVKLLYRCLFLFYSESRHLLPSDEGKLKTYERHSIRALCQEAHKFRWGKRRDTSGYDLWKHLKGLVNAVNDGDAEYGIMGYNGGLFDDEREKFLGKHQLRNDFLARALYLLAYVEPFGSDQQDEYEIPYEDLEVRHLGELYENILEYAVILADADRIRRRGKAGVEFLLLSDTKKQPGDTLIKKGDVYFGESALERKQTGSYYTPESLVRFLNAKTITEPLREEFEKGQRRRFDEFLAQIDRGHDDAARKGAARSALALVDQFCEKVILTFKVCDPAMGSGHFLVDAANQMAGLVIELLEEIPGISGLGSKSTSDPNYWRRRVTRSCLYGVDINPLAVELAKLSLWLNSFARDHRLTFLDHHLRCGNSLVGVKSLEQLKSVPKRRQDRESSTRQQALFQVKELAAFVAEAATDVRRLSSMGEDETEEQKEGYDKAYAEIVKRVAPLCDLFIAYLIDGSIDEESFDQLFRHYIDSAGARPRTIHLSKIHDSARSVSNDHKVLHWPLEFPDVFSMNGGFDATIGNPPWDVLQPNSQEFFSAYDVDFRSYDKGEAIQAMNRLLSSHSHIGAKWDHYQQRFEEASTYFKQIVAYDNLNVGKVDLYRAFLERFSQLLCEHGRMGLVTPSGIYTDQNCQPLREMLLERHDFAFMLGFENRQPVVFKSVDSRFKFVLLGATKGGHTKRIQCCFMQHDPERLPAIYQNAIAVPAKEVRKLSPYLSFLEFRSQIDVDLCNKIFSHPPLTQHKGLLSGIFFADEINLTNAQAAGIISKRTRDAYPLWEGKLIDNLDSTVSPPTLWISEDVGKRFILRNAKHSKATYRCDRYRLSYRRIAASTNERTIVSSIIPQHCFSSYSLYNILLETDRPKAIAQVPNARIQLLLASVFSSFVFDYVARLKFSMNLVPTEVCEIPFVDSDKIGELFEPLIARAARLICTSNAFADLWSDAYVDSWRHREFWYPSGTSGLTRYGPEHEAETRNRIAEGSRTLTKVWSTESGLRDKSANGRDVGDRAQIRAEIDAYVAHLYGLTREDVENILNTFPVLQRKEVDEFGEYVSKRKCLEEFDRIGAFLKG